jgi:hypothetical protein
MALGGDAAPIVAPILLLEASVLVCATKRAQEVPCSASHSPRNRKRLGNRSA